MTTTSRSTSWRFSISTVTYSRSGRSCSRKDTASLVWCVWTKYTLSVCVLAYPVVAVIALRRNLLPKNWHKTLAEIFESHNFLHFLPQVARTTKLHFAQWRSSSVIIGFTCAGWATRGGLSAFTVANLKTLSSQFPGHVFILASPCESIVQFKRFKQFGFVNWENWSVQLDSKWQLKWNNGIYFSKTTRFYANTLLICVCS